jgi:hypothetical protein
MRRRALLLGLLVCISAVLFIALWLTTRTHQISDDGFRNLRQGMTMAEVEVVLGVPPGVYGSVTKGPLVPFVGPGRRAEIWLSDGYQIIVSFDEQTGRSVGASGCPFPVTPTPFLHRLRRWFGL